MRDREDELLAEQRLALQVVVVHRQREQADVELTGAQPFVHHGALLLDEQQLEVGEALVQGGHDVGQQVGRQGGEQPEAKRARLGVGGPAGDVADVVGLAQHHPGTFHDRLADVGQHDLPGAALDQLHAELVLQLLQLGRQRRLADEARLGGATEVAVVRNGDQVPEVLQVHVRTSGPAAVE